MSTALVRNAQTKGQRILQALTNEELSDDKPSQFLRRIQRLLGGASDNVARQLFLRKLPLPIRTGLTPFQDRPLTEQAELADQIAALKPTTTINAVSSDISNFASRLECLESPYMNSCNAATNRQMTTAIQKAVTITQHSASITTDIDFSLFYGDIRKASVIVNATNDVNDNFKIEDAALELDLTERMANFSVSTDIDFSLFYGDVRKTPVFINATNDVIDNVKIEDLVLELDLIEPFSKSGQVYAVKRFMPSARHSELMKFSISCARPAFWQSPNTFDGTFDSESELSVASRTGQICGNVPNGGFCAQLVLVKPGGDYVCKSLFAGTLPTALPASSGVDQLHGRKALSLLHCFWSIGSTVYGPPNRIGEAINVQMDQVIKSAQDAAGTLERKLLQEFPSREAIEKYRGELVRLLCQGDKLKTLRHGTHSSVEWEQCAYLMWEQVGAAGEWLRQKCQVSTEFSGGHSDSMSAVAGSFDGLSGPAESSESCLLEADSGVQSTRTWMWTQSCLLMLMQMTVPLIMYKMEKKNSLKRRAAEELKTIPQIYHEEASSASADLETAGINVLKRRCTGNGRKNF
ncbi:hypothetical protein T02_3541 [Trichinella nativa]|uniref:Uncharacterized protein n=1 Tax=Trichinella nativa TaxID=6335 RepID=A0A0V1LPW2_9BILA|nr:hypothetical protein T02_3541 [Trichinella nativa]